MISFVQELAALSSAEDFFAFFGLSYDPRVLAASRLHILKRFHDNLSTVTGLEAMDDGVQHAIYRQQLQRAYADFANGPVMAGRVFPRLLRSGGGFVALASLSVPRKGRI